MSTPTITEARRVALGAALALAVWFAGMAALAIIVDPVAVIAFGPADRIASAIVGADASIVTLGRGFVVARSDAAGLPRKLYAGGAWIVWPALPRRCGGA